MREPKAMICKNPDVLYKLMLEIFMEQTTRRVLVVEKYKQDNSRILPDNNSSSSVGQRHTKDNAWQDFTIKSS